LPELEIKDDQQPAGKILPQLYFGTRDADGRSVNPSRVWDLHKTARTYNLKSSERGAIAMESRIRRLASQLKLPNGVVQRAVYLYQQAQKRHVIKKPSLNDWALSLIFTTCREMHYIITIEDLVAHLASDSIVRQRSKSNVRRYYNLVKSAFGLRISPPETGNYVVYFSGKLGMTNQPIIQRALEIARLHINESPNSTPHCVAAGALYIALEKSGGFSQKSFCKQTNLSEISLRHWVDRLGGYREAVPLIPDVQSSDLVLQEYQDEHPESEYPTDDGSQSPPTPYEGVSYDGRADEDHDHADVRPARKEVRNRLQVKVHPLRVRNRAEKVAKTRKKKPNRKHLPVNHPTASPLRARRTRRKARK
jgi:transcription initiation factor TFIIIB Brf1 subunit/transcription initiation factor TFIIB